jgi:hypothetical protein
MPAFIDSLTILDTSNVLARRNTKVEMREYHLTKQGDHWVIESATRTHVYRYSPESK